jgi:hypothetical protein
MEKIRDQMSDVVLVAQPETPDGQHLPRADPLHDRVKKEKKRQAVLEKNVTEPCKNFRIVYVVKIDIFYFSFFISLLILHLRLNIAYFSVRWFIDVMTYACRRIGCRKK